MHRRCEIRGCREGIFFISSSSPSPSALLTDVQTTQLKPVKQHYPLLKLVTPFIVEENIGKEREGKTRVTIRFIIPESVYDEYLSEATFRSPFVLPKDFERMGPQMKSAVQVHYCLLFSSLHILRCISSSGRSGSMPEQNM